MPDSILRKQDKIYVFCNPDDLESAMKTSLRNWMHTSVDGSVCLTENIVLEEDVKDRRKGLRSAASLILQMKKSSKPNEKALNVLKKIHLKPTSMKNDNVSEGHTETDASSSLPFSNNVPRNLGNKIGAVLSSKKIGPL